MAVYQGSLTVKRRAKDGVPGRNAHSPYIGANGNWYFWDDATGQFKDSGLSAQGDDGHSPYINTSTNTWYEWDATTGAYKDTGIEAKGVDGDGVTGSTIHYVIADSGSTIPTTGWSTNIPTPVKGKYLWTRTTTTFKVLSDKVSYSVSYYGTDGVGTNGLPGQVPIQKEWVVGDTHRYNDDIKDYIYVRGTSQNTSYWYTRTSKGDVVAGAAPVGGANIEGYTRVDWMKTLAVNVLLAEEANLANFIFKDEKLISVRGTVNGVETNYSGQANFKPYIILDGKTGKIYAEDAEITGTVNATSGKFTGEVNATDGNIGGMHISGDAIVSENGRLVIDGTNNTIYLLDDSGAIKTVIRPNDIPTSVSSYFSGSLNQNVSFLGIKGTVFGAATQDSNTIALSGNAYEVTIPPLTLAASSTYTGSGVGSAILTLKLVLSNGGSANDIPVAQVMAISTSTEGYDQVVLPETKKMITKSGTWRLRLISIPESVGGGTPSYNGSLTSSATTFNVSEIVNRSEIGSNGMMVATSANNYNFMVGGTFEVRRGNGGLRITNSGIQKWNGTSWVAANI